MTSRASIEKLVGVWQSRLGLDHWQIRIDWSTPTENDDELGVEALAEIDATLPYDRARIRFHADVETWPLEAWGSAGTLTADYVIAHELIHALMSDLDETAMELDDGMYHRDAAEIRNRIYHRQREAFVDRMARAIVAAFDG